jgi:hypothetical protein
MVAALLLGSSAMLASCDGPKPTAKSAAAVKESEFPDRPLWGDTHLHTANSVDAFGFGVRLGPEEALRFARGEEVTATTGMKAKLSRPLDFLVVTDHAEALGGTKAIADAPRLLIRDATMRRWHDMMNEGPAGSQRPWPKYWMRAAAMPFPKPCSTPMAPPNAQKKCGTAMWMRWSATTNPANSPPSMALNIR